MEIIIHQAILHVLDTTMDAPVLSGGPMDESIIAALIAPAKNLLFIVKSSLIHFDCFYRNHEFHGQNLF